MVTDGTHGMALDLFVGEFAVGGDSFPLEGPAGDVFLCGVTLLGSPSSGGLNSIGIGNDTIVLCSKLINDSRIFLINKILLSQLELKLIRCVR